MGLMDGKICIVTGATAGIGYYTAQEIARMGGTVIIIGRNQDEVRGRSETDPAREWQSGG